MLKKGAAYQADCIKWFRSCPVSARHPGQHLAEAVTGYCAQTPFDGLLEDIVTQTLDEPEPLGPPGLLRAA